MSILSSIFGILGTLLSLFGGSNTTRTVYGPRVTEFRATNSKYGIAIAEASGTIRQSGNLIWASSVEEREIETKQTTKSGGLFGLGGSKVTTVTINYEYFQSFAIAFAKGTASKFLRIFADGQVIADYRGTNTGPVNYLFGVNDENTNSVPSIRFYYGDGTNVQDPVILANVGPDSTPTYNEIVYAVFEGLQLRQFGNRIPTITAEIVYATANIATTLQYISEVPTEEVFIGKEYITTQDASSYTIFDLYNRLKMYTKYYIDNTVLKLPYTDIYGHIYSSYLYTGTASNLIQYDLLSGKLLYAYDMGDPSAPIVAIDFDNSNSYIYGISDLGVYRFDMSPTYLNPVIRSTAGVERLSDNRMSAGVLRGTIGSDIAVDIDGAVYALFYDTTSNNKTYIVKYSKNNGFSGVIWGPLVHASYTNPIDSSAILDSGDLITIDSNFIYVGSSTSNWVVNISKLIENTTYNIIQTPISTFDRTNFRASKYQQFLHLDSGEVIDLILFTLSTAIDLPSIIGTAVVHAYFIPAIDAYFVYDAVNVQYVYVRSSAAGDSLKHIIENIIANAQLPNQPSLSISDTDFSSLLTIIVDGYAIDAQKTLVDMISPLAKVFNFDIVESDGKLVSLLRGEEVLEAEIYERELTSNGNDIPIINIVKLLDAELPLIVTVTYPQRSIDYQQATQTARKLGTKATDMQDVAVDVVMSPPRALLSAQIILKDAWKGKDQYAFTLPRKYAYLNAGDLIQFLTDQGDLLFIRINSIAYGENISLDCTGSGYDTAIYSSLTETIVEGNGSSIVNSYPTTLGIAEIPYPFRGETNAANLYYYIYSMDTNDTYSVYQTNEFGATTQIATYDKTPIAGTLVSITNNGLTVDRLYGPENIREIDYSNNLLIQFTTPISVLDATRDSVFNDGYNYILVGDETLYYKNIVYNGNGTYTFSGLYRDRLGYEPIAYNSHISVGEKVVILNTSIAHTTPNATGNVLYYAISNSSLTNRTNTVYTTINNIGLKCFPPAKVAATKSTNDLIVTWSRRDRISDNWGTHAVLANSESQEKYGIDVYSTDGVLKRTKTISDVSTITYLGSEQIIDFGAYQTDYYIKVFQYNSADEKGFYSVLNWQTNEQYFNDMSAETVGVQLSNSIKTWDIAGISYDIIVGKYLEINQTTVGNKCLKLNDKLIVRNCEVLIKFRIPTTGGFTVVLRGKDDTSGLAFTINSTLTSIKFSNYTAGVESVVVSNSKAIDANVWHFLKIKHISTLVSAKLWKSHLYEPPNWDITGYWEETRECGFVGLGSTVNSSLTEISQIKITVL